MATIAEELLLLVTRPNGHHGLTSADVAVAGALVAELAGREHVTVDERRRLQLVDAGATGDPLLDEALLRLGPLVGKNPKTVIQKLGKGMSEKAYERLAVAELVDRKEHRLMGLTLHTSWPPLQPHRTDALRAELVDVLAGRREPDLRTGTLVSLLRATSSLGRALPREARVGLPMSDVRRRAKEISQGRWAPEAVRKAVEELNSAVMVAVMAGGAASSS